MGFETRAATSGNKSVDYTKIRENIKNVSPAVQATLRNATPKNGVAPDREEVGGTKTINEYKLTRLSNIISNNINSAYDLRAITPMIDKANLIWNTIILYPNGKQDKMLTYDSQSTKIKNAAMHTGLLSIWDDYYTNDYKIESLLKKMLDDIMWNTGSYAIFNLSRPGLDYLINGSEVDPSKRTGNEEYTKACSALNAEFVVGADGKNKVRNKGRFVRNPYNPTKAAAISGLESLFTSSAETTEEEFPIFDPKEDTENLFGITITDNPSVLYLQKFQEAKRNRDITSVMGAESFDNIISSAMQSQKGRDAEAAKAEEEESKKGGKDKKTPKDDKEPKGDKKGQPHATTQNLTEDQLNHLNATVFKSRNIRSQSLQFIKSNDSLSVAPYGRGLSWHIPSEAIFPIHFNGSNGKIDDYIILLDPETGEFLKNTDDPEFYQSLAKNKESIGNKNKMGSDNSLISSLRAVQSGNPCDFDMSEFADMAQKSIVRQFISAVYSDKGKNISITLDEEVNKIFLSRIFKKQGVRCLYVPGEAVSYGAIKFNRLGIGQSLTQAAKMHIARLAAYDLADALANLEAAQPHTEMVINIEKEDSDPEQTIAIARATFFDCNPKLHSILSTAQLSVPQVVDALREASLSVKVNAGDNVHLPTPDISTQGKQKDNFHPVDKDSRDAVMNSISNYFNLPRAWLDVADDQNNFKIEAVTEYEMVFNQAVNWQEMICEFLIDFMRKHARVNGPLMQDLVQYILDNKKLWGPDSKEALEGSDEDKVKVILADFFSSVYCYLPVPTSTESTNKLKDSLEAVTALVQAWEEAAGNNGVLPQILKALAIENEDFTDVEIKAMVKSALTSEAFRRFNLPMPFDDIVNEGKGGGIASLVQQMLHQRINTAGFVADLIDGITDSNKKLKKQYGDKLAKKLAPPEEPVEGEEGGDGVIPDASAGGGTDDASLDTGADTGDQDIDAPIDDSGAGDNPPGDDDAPTVADDAEPDADDTAKDDDAPPADDAPGGKKFDPF
jgi:hypothetical protein